MSIITAKAIEDKIAQSKEISRKERVAKILDELNRTAEWMLGNYARIYSLQNFSKADIENPEILNWFKETKFHVTLDKRNGRDVYRLQTYAEEGMII